MAKLSLSSLMDVHFLTSRFILHSSATELFASVQQLTNKSLAIVSSTTATHFIKKQIVKI